MVDANDKSNKFTVEIEDKFVMFSKEIDGRDDPEIFDLTSELYDSPYVLYNGVKYKVKDYGINSSYITSRGVFWIECFKG
jgi:hypothetical protein